MSNAKMMNLLINQFAKEFGDGSISFKARFPMSKWLQLQLIAGTDFLGYDVGENITEYFLWNYIYNREPMLVVVVVVVVAVAVAAVTTTRRIVVVVSVFLQLVEFGRVNEKE